MYLKYGNYQHAAGEVVLTGITSESMATENAVVFAIKERWDLMGRLDIADQGSAAANQAAMTVALDALKAAYSVNGRDIGFYDDSDKLTSHSIQSSATRSGVIVAVPPSFPDGRGAEYSTFRTYTIAVEAERPFEEGGGLLSWMEAVSFRGTGGPTWGFLVPIVGAVQQQLLTQRSTQFATQRGRAVGNGAYVVPPAPIWPVNEHEELREITREVPPSSSSQRITNWTYVFESPFPLVGVPRARAIN